MCIYFICWYRCYRARAIREAKSKPSANVVYQNEGVLDIGFNDGQTKSPEDVYAYILDKDLSENADLPAKDGGPNEIPDEYLTGACISHKKHDLYDNTVPIIDSEDHVSTTLTHNAPASMDGYLIPVNTLDTANKPYYFLQ